MKISDALKVQSDLEIPFGDTKLRVTYRPSAVTIQDIETLKADRNIGRIAEQIRQQIVQWDLTDEYDRLIPIEKPRAGVVVNEQGAPQEGTVDLDVLADPLHRVPISILTTVLIAVQTAQRPDPQA